MNSLHTTIKLGAGLLLLILANISLGSVDAVLKHAWDAAKFKNSILKTTAILLALVAVYAAGYLNPDLLVIHTGGEPVNLMSTIHIVLLAPFVAYSLDVIKKLKNLLTTATSNFDAHSRSIISNKTDKSSQFSENAAIISSKKAQDFQDHK